MISCRPQYDVIQTPDVIGHVTIGSSICDFVYVINRDQIRISLCFWDIELWKFLSDDVTPILTPRSLDRLSVWIIWTHYAVDDYVTIWSNSVRNCRRYSMLKVVMSRLWRHSHVTSSGTSPFDSPWPLSYRLPIGKYPLSATVSEIFGLKCYEFMTSQLTSCRINYLCGPSRHAI